MGRRATLRLAAWAAAAACCAVLTGASPAASILPVVYRPLYCFFPRGEWRLTEDCKRTLAADALRTWREADRTFGAADAVVVGHAPDGGGSAGNNRLSAARAVTVADELRALGIPDEALTKVRGVGGGAPLVLDPRAPENRYVEVSWPKRGPEVRFVREPVAVTVKDGDLCFALAPELPHRYHTAEGMHLVGPTRDRVRESRAVRNLYSVPNLCVAYADLFGARASDDLEDGRYSLRVGGSFSKPSPDPSIVRSVSLAASFKLSRDARGNLVLMPLPPDRPRSTDPRASIERASPSEARSRPPVR